MQGKSRKKGWQALRVFCGYVTCYLCSSNTYNISSHILAVENWPCFKISLSFVRIDSNDTKAVKKPSVDVKKEIQRCAETGKLDCLLCSRVP